jgi:hypothetical protein
MAVLETIGRPQPRWRRIVSALITAYVIITVLETVVMVAFAVGSGSMDPNSAGSGIVLAGTFTYPQHNASKGRAVEIPVTAPNGFTDPGRIAVDSSRNFTVEDESDFGPFGYAGRGWVTLPKGVSLDHAPNGAALLQPLRTGSRHELVVDFSVGWGYRLLVGLPSVLIWTGVGIASVVFATFVRSIFDGRPFHPKNPRRLLWLAGSLATVVFADSWLRVWIIRFMLDVLDQHGHRIPLHAGNPGINQAPVLVIIGALCLAAAFRAGARMAADTEGLV